MYNNMEPYQIYIEANEIKHPNRDIKSKETSNSDKVISDIYGLISSNILINEKYFISFLNKLTRYLYYKLIVSKVETYIAYTKYKS